MQQRVIINRQMLNRLRRAIVSFLRSSVGGKARMMLIALLILMIGINGMNVANSYVGRYFMSFIESRDTAGFVRFAWLYVAVFAGSTLTGVLFRFTEERLGLLRRDWLTRRITGTFIEQRFFLHLSSDDSLSNPDQRNANYSSFTERREIRTDARQERTDM